MAHEKSSNFSVIFHPLNMFFLAKPSNEATKNSGSLVKSPQQGDSCQKPWSINDEWLWFEEQNEDSQTKIFKK